MLTLLLDLEVDNSFGLTVLLIIKFVFLSMEKYRTTRALKNRNLNV